jgi:RNA polymerase sigma-70 factor (ECF subfamily)
MIMASGIGLDDFEEIYRRTSADILAYLVRRVAAREDAADLLAEVYLIAWRRRHVVPSAPQDRLWLFGVARRQLLAHHRVETRRHATADQLRAELARGSPPTSGRTGGHTEAARAVHDALAQLTEVDQELLTLTVWDGLTPTEAAKVVGLSAGGARVRLHRARAQLAQLLLPAGAGSQRRQPPRVSPIGTTQATVEQPDPTARLPAKR